MENLLAMPVRPIEAMIAKIIPYVFIGCVQVGLILVAAVVFFSLPLCGSMSLSLGALGLFIASNLALGVTVSTVAAKQMQAVQLAQFTLMPSFMLSGFMFPFRGMLLKGAGRNEIAPEMWPMAPFTVVVIVFAVWRDRETPD